MKKTKHIAQFESFRGDSTKGTPNPNAGFAKGSNDYMNGIICIADMDGGGLAVGTISDSSDASYIQELEEFVPSDQIYGNNYAQQLSIQVLPIPRNQDNYFVCFEGGVFDIYGAGDNFKVPSGGYVFTITTEGMFLVLKDGYGQYELLSVEETVDYFAG